jgi:hypothetical protein
MTGRAIALSQESATSQVDVPPDLVTIAHRDRLAARLDPHLAPITLERLRSSARLRPRLARLLLAPAAAKPLPGEHRHPDADTAIAKAIANHSPTKLARLAGAAWHGRALKLVISGREVAGLAQAIGQEAYLFGLRNADLAVEDGGAAEDLAASIDYDGLRCLGLALLVLPKPIRIAVLLRLPPGSVAETVEPDPALMETATAIVARVLSHLEQVEQSPDTPE